MGLFARLFGRKPDVVIGATQYMDRWYIIPRNRLFNVYLHRLRHDDDPRALHDHPWWNVSIVLKGGYWEYMPADPPWPPSVVPQWAHEVAANYSMPIRVKFAAHYQTLRKVWRRPGSVIFRRACDAHRLALGTLVGSRPAWSLFITGPNKRTWGFWLKEGWVPYHQMKAK